MTTPRTFAKGDIVYRNVTNPKLSDYAVPFTVAKVRKARDSEYTKSAYVWLTGSKYAVRAHHLTHHDDLTPDQLANVTEAAAVRAREAAREADSAARLRARNDATLAANRDKLDAAPVYGLVELGPSRWDRVTDDTKPIGARFTYWTTERDRYGVVSVTQREDWCGVTVRRESRGRKWIWVVAVTGATYTAEQAQILAESLSLAVRLIPTFGDPRPEYDRA